jgi:hypothetical protein
MGGIAGDPGGMERVRAALNRDGLPRCLALLSWAYLCENVFCATPSPPPWTRKSSWRWRVPSGPAARAALEGMLTFFFLSLCATSIFFCSYFLCLCRSRCTHTRCVCTLRFSNTLFVSIIGSLGFLLCLCFHFLSGRLNIEHCFSACFSFVALGF